MTAAGDSKIFLVNVLRIQLMLIDKAFLLSMCYFRVAEFSCLIGAVHTFENRGVGRSQT